MNSMAEATENHRPSSPYRRRIHLIRKEKTMKKDLSILIDELKENGQDFEFYPTTEEMLQEVVTHIDWTRQTKDILDIGCGLCGLRKMIDCKNAEINRHNKRMVEQERYNEKIESLSYNYYVIEKSEILLNRLPADVFVLGTDFNQCTLIDKKADIVFCNPPYSEYENWTNRIIREGNFEQAFLIIPSRWKENAEIQASLDATKTNSYVIKSMDFLNAERQARATVDIVKFTRNRYSWRSEEQKSAFDLWFEETFKVCGEDKHLSEYDEEIKQQERIKNSLVSAPNKIEVLINLYNDDMNRLYSSFKALCAMDEKTLEDIGVNYGKVKEALKNKISNLKILYWKMVFDYLDEVTSRLTQQSRQNLFNQFERLNQVDFSESNIRSVVIWVLKNASEYYKDQLIDFYKSLSDFDNVKPYASNKRLFTRDDWRWSKGRDGEYGAYTLDYRMVCSYLFSSSVSWGGEFCKSSNDYKNTNLCKDFCAIARNLGFSIGEFQVADSFGEKFYIYLKDGNPLLEYKIYKNGNTHVKLNIEFAKAMNVEVSRLLGWIRNKQDIAREFPAEMAKGAEKYFGSQFCFGLTNPNIKLLGAA